MITKTRSAVFEPKTFQAQKPQIERLRKARCLYCLSYDTIAKGYRKTSAGLRPIQKCKGCGRKFTPEAKPYLSPPWTTTPCIGCSVEFCHPETCAELGKWLLRTS